MFLEAEDRGALAIVSSADGQLYRGIVRAVGIDHVMLDDAGVERFVALSYVSGLEVR